MAAGTRDDRAEETGTGLHATAAALCMLALWACVGDHLSAQPAVQLQTHVSTDSVLIGGRFTVSFVAEHDGAVDVSFPDPRTGPGQFGDVEIRRRRAVEQRTIRGGGQVDSAAYEVTTFALDSARVPPVPLQIVGGRDTTVASTPPRGVTVVSVIKENRKGIHSVAPLASFPRPIWPWVLAGLAAVVLIGGLAYYFWWAQRGSEEEVPGAIGARSDMEQTPYEAATAWIRQLESYNLSDPEAVKPFYVELSNAVRVYVANELEVGALEHTTNELIQKLDDRSDVPPEAVEHLQSVLRRADLVKFAGIQPASKEHEQALHEARTALDALEAAPRGSIDAVAGASERVE